MQTVIIVFLAFVSLICLFAVLVVVWEIVREARGKGTENSAATPVAPVAQNSLPSVNEEELANDVAPAPVREEVAASAIETEEGKIIVDENAVVFSAGTEETLDEKYLKLPPEYKAYYDEIIRYAANTENVKRIKTARYEEYKVGNARLVRLLIKRGVVVGEFILIDRNLRNYIAENKVRVKPAPVTIKITDDAACSAAKESIDIAVQGIAEEKEFKKQLRRERMRALRAQAKKQD